MKFDNAQFEKNCKETMSTLDKLKEKLHMTKSASSLNELGDVAKGLGLDAIDKSLTSVNKKMSILGIAGATVISELTKSAMNFAKTVTTTVPKIIKEGGWTRAMNIEQAKFQLEGLGIAWAQVGDQISNAVSGTAYSMDSAAKAASQLAASGIEISGVGDQMERTLKAISGVAAQTNSSYDEIANIFTTVAGNGRLMGDQLRQLSYRGMNAAATLAKAFGVTEAEIRDMVSKGEISFATFSEIMFQTFGENAFKANQTFQGSLDNMKAALKRTGEAFAGPVIRQMIPVFNSLRLAINKANKEIFKFSSNNVTDQSKFTDAIKAAKDDLEKLNQQFAEGKISQEEYETESKRLTGTIEELEKGLEDCYGPFEKIAKTVQENIVGVIDKINFRFLKRTMEGFINLLKAGYSIIKPFGQAFLDVFGISTRGINIALADFSIKFEKFTKRLILSSEEMDYLKRAFRGVISVMTMFSYVVKTILSALLGVNVETGGLRKTLLTILGTIGDAVYVFTDWIKKSDILAIAVRGVSTVVYTLVGVLTLAVTKIAEFIKYIYQSRAFQTVLSVIQKTLTLITGAVVLLAQKIVHIFTELRKGNISVLGPLGTLLKLIHTGLTFVVGGVQAVFDKISNLPLVVGIVDKLTTAFEKLRDAVLGIFGKKNKSNNEITITDEEVPRGLEGIGDAVKEAGDRVEEAGTKFDFFNNILVDFKDNLTLSRLASLAFVGAIVVISYKVAKALEGIGKGVKGIGSFMGAFAKKGLIGMILGTGDRTPNKIMDTAIALGVLAAALIGIAFLPKEGLKQATEAVTNLMISFTAMMGILTYLDQVSGTLGGLRSITDSMLKVTLAIVGLAGAMSIIANMKGDFIKGVTGLLLIGGELVGMAILLSKFAPTFAVASGSMIGLALSIRIMAGAFKTLLKIKDSVEGSIELIKSFALFTGALVSIGSLAMRLGGGSSFLRLSLSILALTGAATLIYKLVEKVDVNELKKMLDAWSEFLKNNVPYFAFCAAVAAGSLVLVYTTLKGLPSLAQAIFRKLGDTLSTGRTMADEVRNTVDYMGRAINKLGVAAIITAVTASIIALSGLVFVLSKIKDKKAMQDAIYQLLLPLVGMVSILMIVSSMTKDAKPTALLASILAIGVILGSIMAIALMVRGDLEGTIAGVVGIGIIMSAWIAMMKIMSLIKYDESSYKGIIASIVGIVAIVVSIGMLANTYREYGAETLGVAIGGLAALMVGLGLMLKYIGSKGMVISQQKRVALLETIGAIVAMAAGVSAIAYFGKDADTIFVSAGALGGVMAVFAYMASILGTTEWNPETWKAFNSIALLAVAIGGTLSLMVGVIGDKYDQLVAAFGSLTAVAMIFAVIIKVLSELSNGEELMKAMLGMAITTVAIGGTLAGMVTIIGDKYGQLAASVGALIVVAGIFAAIVKVLSDQESVKKGLASLLVMSITAVAIAGALAILAQFKMGEIIAALVGLAGAAAILYAVAKGFEAIAETGIGAIAVLLVALLAAAFSALAVACAIVIESLTQFIPVFQEFSKAIITLLIDNKDSLAETGMALIPFAAGLVALGLAGVTLILGVPGLVAGSSALLALFVPLLALSSINITQVSDGLTSLLVPLLGLGAVSSILAACAPAMMLTASALIMFAGAVAIATDKISNDTIKSMSKMPAEAYSIGLNTLLGLRNGLLNGGAIKNIKLAAAGVANMVTTTMRDVLGVHSPGTEGEYTGINNMLGFANGLDNSQVWNMISGSMEGNLGDLLDTMDMSEDSGKAGKDTGDAFIKEAVSSIDSGIPLLDIALYKVKSRIDQFKNTLSHINEVADSVAKKNGKDYYVPYQNYGGNDVKDDEQRKKFEQNRDKIRKQKEEKESNPFSNILDGLGDINKSAGGASKSVDKLTDSVLDLSSAFEPLEKNQRVSLSGMINNLVSNYQATASWAKDMKLLMGKGYDKAITDWVKSMGTAGHETVKALMNGTAEEVNTMNSVMKQYLTLDSDAENYILGKYDEFGNQIAVVLSDAVSTFDGLLAQNLQDSLDPFGEFNAKTEMTGTQLLNNMNSQLSGFRKWGENLQILMGRNVDEGIIDEFKRMGIASYEEVNAMVNMTDAQLAEANEVWRQQLTIGEEVARGLADRAREVGFGISEGLVEGIDYTAASDAGLKLAQDTIKASKSKQGFDINSPSKPYIAIGSGVIEGLELGIKVRKHIPVNLMIILATECINESKKILNFEAGKTIGEDLTSGMEKGISEGGKTVISAIKSLCDKVVAKANEILDRHSPSKVFRDMFYDVDRGAALGVEDGTGLVSNSIANMGYSVIDRMTRVMSDIADNVNGEFEDLSPVVSPKLDLTELQNGRSLIDRIFGGTSYNLSSSIAADNNINNTPSTVNADQTQAANNQTIIFNQTNNSPKNIDPYESYRLNRLAAEQLKGAFT